MSDGADSSALQCQVDRIESMLLHLYFLNCGNYLNWQDQEISSTSASAAFDPPVPGLQEHTCKKASVSSSKQRRIRAKVVRTSLWQRAQGICTLDSGDKDLSESHARDSDDKTVKDTQPINIEDADPDAPIFSKRQVQIIIGQTSAGCHELLEVGPRKPSSPLRMHMRRLLQWLLR